MKGVIGLGCVEITGDPDSGKTMAIITCGAQPEEIAFFDDDVKSGLIVDELAKQGRKFGFYVDLVKECSGMKELEYHDYIKSWIKQLELEVADGKKYECIGFDTWSRFSATFQPYVEEHMGDFRSKWNPMGKIKGAQIWQSSFTLEAEFISRLTKIAPLVILTTHLKNQTIGEIRTGKMVPDNKKSLIQKANLRVWLRNNPESQLPVGLILKRIGKRIVSENGIEVQSVLPRKMVPFTWERVKYYWENPVGNRPLTKEELMTEYELSIIEGTLTTDQKMVLDMALKYGSGIGEEAIDTKTFDDDTIIAVKKMKDNNIPLPAIAKELNISVSNVALILSK